MNKPVYLDYNATTPLHPEVVTVMKQALEDTFGNPSSTYSYGASARTLVEEARKQVAALVGCRSHEILFTSGGSESNNLAVKGAAMACRNKGNHIITSTIEHPAVAEVCRYLERQGFEVTWLPVDPHGLVSVADLEEAIAPHTILVTIMHANNEVGTIQPIRELASVARKHGILFHTDAAQTAGKISIQGLGVDMLSLAGHKLYGPKGVGALFVREGVRLEKLIHGADHEQNLRAGTENVPSIAGLGKACELALHEMKSYVSVMQGARDRLMDGLKKAVPGIVQNGHPLQRLPNTLSVSFPGIEAAVLLSAVGGEVAASAGAACHSDRMTISPTLEAMNVSPAMARGTVRFSTGRFTTDEEIDRALDKLTMALQGLTGSTDIPADRENGVRLTQFTQGLGCACKLRPQVLEEVMRKIPLPAGEAAILVGPETFDDAAVYQVSDDLAVVQTLDFFTPVLDDPYDFGAVAAANALSDIYAMGARPVFALNIAAFPSARLPVMVLERILEGAADKAREAGISILGGHTVDDPEPKFGMSVTGFVHPGRILRNSTARTGDVLVLTKPLGTGIMATALKRGLLDQEAVKLMTDTMARLNKDAAEVMAGFPVSACTDITGFGLLGHLREVTGSSAVDAEIFAGEVPVLPAVAEMAAAGVVPGGGKNNLEHVSPWVSWSEGYPEFKKLILCDPQTSGGLLISLPEPAAGEMVSALAVHGISGHVIGRIPGPGQGRITVRP
jgi:cysteine desulfurase NifS/selenium donor protein